MPVSHPHLAQNAPPSVCAMPGFAPVSLRTADAARITPMTCVFFGGRTTYIHRSTCVFCGTSESNIDISWNIMEPLVVEVFSCNSPNMSLYNWNPGWLTPPLKPSTSQHKSLKKRELVDLQEQQLHSKPQGFVHYKALCSGRHGDPI